MKTAILGGSYNPVHLGHLALGRAVHEAGYDCVLFIPASCPPHKTLAGGAQDMDRVAMLELALENHPWAQVWDGELRRSGFSYTFDTIVQLKKEGLVTGRPGLVIGDDLAPGFRNWYQVDHLLTEVDILLARREEEQDVPVDFPCHRLKNPLWPHSSTAIRHAIALGAGLEDYLPLNVAQYIQERGLYGRG